MIFTSKEEFDSWKAFNKYSWEINLCMQEQYPTDNNTSDEDTLMFLDVYSEIMDEYSSQRCVQEQERKQ